MEYADIRERSSNCVKPERIIFNKEKLLMKATQDRDKLRW